MPTSNKRIWQKPADIVDGVLRQEFDKKVYQQLWDDFMQNPTAIGLLTFGLFSSFVITTTMVLQHCNWLLQSRYVQYVGPHMCRHVGDTTISLFVTIIDDWLALFFITLGYIGSHHTGDSVDTWKFVNCGLFLEAIVLLLLPMDLIADFPCVDLVRMSAAYLSAFRYCCHPLLWIISSPLYMIHLGD